MSKMARAASYQDHHKNGTKCLPARVMSLAVQPGRTKSLVVYGTVYIDIYYKNLLGSIIKVEYCILVPD